MNCELRCGQRRATKELPPYVFREQGHDERSVAKKVCNPLSIRRTSSKIDTDAPRQEIVEKRKRSKLTFTNVCVSQPSEWSHALTLGEGWTLVHIERQWVVL